MSSRGSFTLYRCNVVKIALLSFQIRPNFRPNFRRPPFTTKKLNTTVSNDIVPTTESIVPTYQSNRRRRPTTTTTASILAATEPSAKNSIKRKYSTRPNIDRRRYTPLSTSTTSTTTETPATRTEPYRSTTNKFFRRRYNYFSTTTKQPAKNTTTATKISTTTTLAPAQDDKNQFSNADQKIEPSILDSKFVNNRFNQIGENLKDDGLIEAITATISKAPLPVSVSTTTTRYSYNSFNTEDDEAEFYKTDEPITKRIGVNFSTSKFRGLIEFTVQFLIDFSTFYRTINTQTSDNNKHNNIHTSTETRIFTETTTSTLREDTTSRFSIRSSGTRVQSRSTSRLRLLWRW